MPPALAFAALPPSISRYACISAASYSSWNRDARCAFTSSCCTLTCESDEMIRRVVVMPVQCCTPGAPTEADGRVTPTRPGGSGRWTLPRCWPARRSRPARTTTGPMPTPCTRRWRCSSRSANEEADAQRAGRDGVRGDDRLAPHPATADRAVLRRAPGDRRPADRVGAVRPRPAPHRVDRAQLPPRPGSRGPEPAPVGGVTTDPTARRSRPRRPTRGSSPPRR